MANIHLPDDWALPEAAATAEEAYVNRRRFLKALGLGGIAATGAAVGGRRVLETAFAGPPPKELEALNAKRNPAFADVGRALSDYKVPTRYNNFYEFTTDKTRVRLLAQNFELDPYTLVIDGLVDKPLEMSLADVEKLGLEERVYRFRCVEAWSMTVPWVGVPLAKLLKHVGVKNEAKYLSFTSFLDPKQAPGQKDEHYSWPYFEALRVDEAMNDLAMVVTGLYGKRLPPQSGSPLRIIVPWKYGFKSPKSVVRIELTKKRPGTFWNKAVPSEYSWLSNVEPEVPHARWSQAQEKHITDVGTLGLKYEQIPTLPYNGYAKQVAGLYKKKG